MRNRSVYRIFVATDGSAGADRAVDTASMLAKTSDADLIILTIGGNISGAELRKLAETAGDLSEAMENTADKILTRARKRALHAGARRVKVETGWGDPAETIIDAIRRQKANMLVIGRRGRGRLSGILLGSVSQKLATLAPCVVVVVP